MAKLKEQLRDLRGLKSNQLYDRIMESRKKLTNLRQDKLLGKLKNVREITHLRKAIARMQTILDEKISEQITQPQSK